jgi:zinc-ribbon domain
MSTDYMSSTRVSDHGLTLAIPGEVGNVRARLIEAIQRLGYKILGEQPLYAKRRSQGAACYDCSLNVLDYPTTLTISLKQVNDVSVLATFNYEVKSFMRMTKGDRQTLAREAEAIAAIATERLTSSCRACGTEISDESHFCRRCGAPLLLDVPELEVLRLTRGTRSSFHAMVAGMFAMLLTFLAVFVILMIGGVRLSGPLLWVAIPLASYALFLLIQGAWKLHHTLNLKAPTSVTTSARARVSSSITTALPPARANNSITEGTTELLFTNRESRIAEPIRRKDASTGEIETDRLM